MYGLVPNKHQGSLSSEDILLLLPPQVYKLVLLDLPGLLFFSTYTLLVLFWAEIYHQVPHSPFVLNHLHFFSPFLLHQEREALSFVAFYHQKSQTNDTSTNLG